MIMCQTYMYTLEKSFSLGTTKYLYTYNESVKLFPQLFSILMNVAINFLQFTQAIENNSA